MQIRYLNGLRALEAVLRKGSVAAAAKEIGVTQAAVGQQIRGLEASLGTVLFERRPGGLEPTEAAREVAGRLTAGLAMLGDVLEDLEAPRSARRIGVTLPESFAENWFTLRISGFYREEAGVDLRLDASNRRQDLAQGPFQFAIRYAPPPDATLAAIDLFGDCVLPVCAPGFAARHGLSEETRSLANLALVHLDNRTPDPDWASWRDWAARFGVDPGETDGGVRYSRVASGLRAALSGQGLVLCGLVEAHDDIARGQLVTPFGLKNAVPTGYRYRLLWLKGRRLSPLQQQFRDWVVETARAFADANPVLPPAPGAK